MFGLFAFQATNPIEVADIGVDVGLLVQQGIATLGGVVAIAVGGYAAFLIVKKGLNWLNTSLRS